MLAIGLDRLDAQLQAFGDLTSLEVGSVTEGEQLTRSTTSTVTAMDALVAKLLAITNERMDVNSAKPGAQELAAAF